MDSSIRMGAEFASTVAAEWDSHSRAGPNSALKAASSRLAGSCDT